MKRFTESEIRQHLEKLNRSKKTLSFSSVQNDDRARLAIEAEFSKEAGWFAFYGISLRLKEEKYYIADPNIVDDIIDEEDDLLLQKLNEIMHSFNTSAQKHKIEKSRKMTQIIALLKESGYELDLERGVYIFINSRPKFGE